jgi:hypothetical protein
MRFGSVALLLLVGTYAAVDEPDVPKRFFHVTNGPR